MANKLIRGCLGVLAAVFFATLFNSRASSHAVLIRSDPADNSILVEPPAVIRVWFNETISPEFSSARLLDIQGVEVELERRYIDPDDPYQLVLVPPELEQGLYSIHWKALSEADGHYTQGRLVFGIGDVVDASAVELVLPVERVPFSEVMLRWMNFGFLAMFTGAVLVSALPIVGRSNPPHVGASIRIRRWGRICLAMMLVCGLAWFYYQFAILWSGVSEGASPLIVARQLLLRTRWGNLWLARMLLTFVLVWSLPSLMRDYQGWRQSGRMMDTSSAPLRKLIPNKMVNLLILTVLLVVLQSMTGHAAAISPGTGLAVAVDTLHLLAASLWVGGLVALAVGVLPLLHADRATFSTEARATWGAFSRWAALSVGVLLATGLFSTGTQIVTPDAMVSSLYGRTLLGKFGLMLVMGVIGLLNSMLLHPRLAEPFARLLNRPKGWTPLTLLHLPALVLVEASAGILVILLAGLLTAVAPARGPGYDPPPEFMPESISQTQDDMLVTFSAQPNLPGDNVITIRAVSRRRPAPYEVMRVIVRFKAMDQEGEIVSTDAQLVEPDTYRLGGRYLRQPGPYQIDVVVRRRGVEDSVTSFAWNVKQPGGEKPVIISNKAWSSELSLLASIVLALVGMLAAGIWLFGQRAGKVQAENR